MLKKLNRGFAVLFVLLPISIPVRAGDGILLWSVDKAARIDIFCDEHTILRVRLIGRHSGAVLPPPVPAKPTLNGYFISYTADGSTPFEERWEKVRGGAITVDARQAKVFLGQVLGRHMLFVSVSRLTSFEFNLERQADIDWKPLRPCLW